MALGSTQLLIEMSTRNLSGEGGGGKGRPARGSDTLTAICEPIVRDMWETRRLTTLWGFMASYRDSFLLFFDISSCIIHAIFLSKRTLKQLMRFRVAKHCTK
jgi:hypothetical protein